MLTIFNTLGHPLLYLSLSLSLPLSHLNHGQHVADEGAEHPVLHDEHEDGEGHDEGQLQQEGRRQVQHARQRVLLLILGAAAATCSDVRGAPRGEESVAKILIRWFLNFFNTFLPF